MHMALVELQTALSRVYGRHAPDVLIYGSQARGDATQASDVDVLLLYSQPVLRGQVIA